MPKTQGCHPSPTKADSMILSLDQKPEKGGIPRMASQPIMNVSHVTFMYPDRAPKRRMSTWSFMPCMTDPAPRNIPALKNPWVMRWKIANAYPIGPRPAASIM